MVSGWDIVGVDGVSGSVLWVLMVLSKGLSYFSIIFGLMVFIMDGVYVCIIVNGQMDY